ncbi:hypothetical protein [Streptomyces sp. SID9124]|uniref:hypothetical protein n=1 Tax=Streptomyces sp. SID9124 TaxID=2706108 RepID=UPI0013E0BB75|nr:hypothetical protein [Streptomyces sp. SID9124]NED11550.1 hypothetical protein [Streptomyces sp. SID9124]
MGNSEEIEKTSTERDGVDRVALDSALLEALDPVATSLRARSTGLPPDQMWAADPVEVSLSVLAAWKVVDEEVKRLTAIAARTAGSYGATYERLGAAWGITRQGARKKWPDAVGKRREGSTLELFGGRAELSWEEAPGGWCWSGRGADGTDDAGRAFPTKEEAAAHAGAFLKEHAG